MNILIINGPNLNMLGRRDASIYGKEPLDHTLEEISRKFPDCDFDFFQSNHEGDIIDRLHQTITGDKCCDGIVMNPGALAHYSYALADAIECCPIPVVEIHISNIFAREEHRHHSVTGRYAKSVITGCGRMGYTLAVEFLLSLSGSHRK